MTDYMAQMLNELMGSQRDSLPGEKKDIKFDNPDVCTDFLVGFCTHDIFKNTKNDLGFCEYLMHDDNMRLQYQESNKKWKLGFEEKFLERIRRLHTEVRRKIEKNEQRLVMTQGESKVAEEAFEKKRSDLQEQRQVLAKRMEALMEEAQLEGQRGNVGAAQIAVEQIEKLKEEQVSIKDEEDRLLSEKARAVTMEENVTAGNRQMQVCQVCGCFMLQNDAQQRIDDHLSGKLHIAYQTIADQLVRMEKEVYERRNSRGDEKSRERDRDCDRERDRDRVRDKEREKERERDRDREKKRDDRKRPERSRSRDRDRGDRRRSNDRDRDRDRNRDKNRDRRDRDRDRRR